jgi:hypothetical protein
MGLSTLARCERLRTHPVAAFQRQNRAVVVGGGDFETELLDDERYFSAASCSRVTHRPLQSLAQSDRCQLVIDIVKKNPNSALSVFSGAGASLFLLSHAL